MQSKTFGNFHIGMLENPSIEDKGGFEFAAGMDIFTEPGVMKASQALKAVTLGAGVTLSDLPKFMVDMSDGVNVIKAYVAYDDKIIKSTDGITFNTFITDGQGTIKGLGIWNAYAMYASASKLGRVPVDTAASKDDTWQTLDTDSEYHPMIPQGGTFKVGAGRYVASVDESFNFTAQALKLQVDYRVKTLADHFGRLFVGTRIGAGGGSVQSEDASVFDWPGTVLSSGSALPDNSYPLKLRAMHQLYSDGAVLWGFPDRKGLIHTFDGVKFAQFKRFPFWNSVGDLGSYSVSSYLESLIFGSSGDSGINGGVYQVKNGAVCQAFIPSQTTPGSSDSIVFGLVKSSFNGTVFIGYSKSNNYYLEKTDTATKQTGAFVRTSWHRLGTDRLKRWGGVKLNMKPMAASTSVAVAYRTSRDASFTDSGATITSANQDKPVYFSAQPRAREIQFKFTFTTNANNSPELLTYDPIFEALNSIR